MRPGVSLGVLGCPGVSWGNQTDPLHNRSKNEYGYVYCYLMLYRFIYGHSLSSYDTVPVLVSVDWPYSQQTRCWRKGHVFYFHYYYFLYIYIY